MKKVCISAGHRPGAEGASYLSYTEHQHAKWWVQVLKFFLADYVQCIEVPTGHLKKKVGFINSQAADFCIEIHFNSAIAPDGARIGKGSETLYCPGSDTGMKAAKFVQGNLGVAFPPDRGVKEGWYQMKKENGPDYFLKRTNCPALIVEPEFIHLTDNIVSGTGAGCEAIGKGILAYLSVPYTPSEPAT